MNARFFLPQKIKKIGDNVQFFAQIMSKMNTSGKGEILK